jgi:REP element-mobilizing transposase RayT
MEVHRRIDLPRSFFHVMNRGARKVSIFADEVDRRIFVSMLGSFATKYEVGILAWCLMPNHYHLEPDTDGRRLCAMMRDLDGNYARSFNERHDTSGCLFQGPFKSILIEDLAGVAHVSRYIHLNPIDLGEPPVTYRWSSCSSYLGHTEAPPWVDLDPVFLAIRNEDCGDVENYRRYLQEGLDRPRKPRKDPMTDFNVEWVRFLEQKCVERLAGKEHLLGRVTLQSLVCYVAQRTHRVPADIVADYFGYSSASNARKAAARVHKRAEEDPFLAAAIQSVLISATQK